MGAHPEKRLMSRPLSFFKLALGWFFVFALVACTIPAPSLPKQTPSAIPTKAEGGSQNTPISQEQVAQTSPEPIPTLPPPSDDTPQIRLQAEMDYAQHIVTVEETITYTNRSSDSLNELLLMVEPNRYDGTFHLNRLQINGEEVESQVNMVEINQMRLPLDAPLLPGKKVQLQIAYQLSLPKPVPTANSRPVPFGWTERQTNLVDWYPFIPPYRSGSGWLAHPPGYFGEHLVYEASDFEVILTIKDNASLQTTAQNPADGETPPAGITIAASAPAQKLEDGSYRFQLQKARSFALSFSHAVTVRSRQVGDITVYSYTFPIHTAAGEAALETTAQSLELYQRLFSPYPHSSLSVVEADFLDGMEYDGLIFLSNGFYNLYQGTPTEYLTAIAAHETAHQWWYGIVGNDQAMEPWLDESLCTYSEKLYYENIVPQALNWWWTYRIDFFKPQGVINGSIYSYSYTANAYEAYRNAVYLNGAKFLEDLRKAIGDAAFFQLLQTYAAENSQQIATTRSFLDRISSVSQENVDSIIQTYFQLNP